MRTDAIAQFLAALDAAGDPDAVASAFARHLAHMTASDLPQPAQPYWHSVAKLLKWRADEPIPAKAINTMRSWPATRIGEAISNIRKMDEVLDKFENERLEDEIRDNIRRHYL